MIGIYKIQNLINHKVYIGQSKDIKRRWEQHKVAAKDPNKRKSNKLYQDMYAFGIENFSFDILWVAAKYSKQELLNQELHYMHRYNSLATGYNILATDGTKQHLVLYDTISCKHYTAATFPQLEALLHNLKITQTKNLTNFLKRAIKFKETIFQHYIVYYDKEEK